MEKEKYFWKLTEAEVRKLPFLGPSSRRIRLLLKNGRSSELFIQKKDAFATNFLGLLERIKKNEIMEISYMGNYDGFFRISLDENGYLFGECMFKTEKNLLELKKLLN